MTANYDGLIADAEKNDGKAREVLPVLRESQEHKEVQDTHRDLPSSRIDRDTNNPFIHRTNRHYIRLDTHKGDPLREIELSNRLIRAGKEHKKIVKKRAACVECMICSAPWDSMISSR